MGVKGLKSWVENQKDIYKQRKLFFEIESKENGSVRNGDHLGNRNWLIIDVGGILGGLCTRGEEWLFSNRMKKYAKQYILSWKKAGFKKIFLVKDGMSEFLFSLVPIPPPISPRN